MATEKKHIAVYLGFAVERALVSFCEQNNLKSKKGIAFSAGVNVILQQFFGIADTDLDNIPQVKAPVESGFNEILPIESAKSQNSQLRKDIAALYVMKTRLTKAAELDGYTPAGIAKAAIKARQPLMAVIKALEEMDDIVNGQC
jgi:hypothetical protein